MHHRNTTQITFKDVKSCVFAQVWPNHQLQTCTTLQPLGICTWDWSHWIQKGQIRGVGTWMVENGRLYRRHRCRQPCSPLCIVLLHAAVVLSRHGNACNFAIPDPLHMGPVSLERRLQDLSGDVQYVSCSKVCTMQQTGKVVCLGLLHTVLQPAPGQKLPRFISLPSPRVCARGGYRSIV